MVITDIHEGIEQKQYLDKIAELEKENNNLRDEISKINKQLKINTLLRVGAEKELNEYRGMNRTK